MARSDKLHARLQEATRRQEQARHYHLRQLAQLTQVEKSMTGTLQKIRDVVIEAIRKGERFDWTDADERVTALFTQLQARNTQLAAQLEIDTGKATAANATVHQLIERQEQAATALEQLDAEIDAVTAQLPAVQTTRTQIADIELLAGRLQEQKEDAEEESTGKRRAYESSPYFRYLWQRGYGSARYKAGLLARRFDRWLAERCYYNENARQYELLLAIPERLQAALAESESQLNDLNAAVAAQRNAIAEQKQRTRAQRALDEATAAVRAAREGVTHIVKRIDAAKDEVARIGTGRHDLHREVTSLVDTAMNSRELARFVAATLSKSDDRLLSAFESDSQQYKQLRAELAQLEVQQQSLQNDIDELQAGLQRAKRQEADAIAAAILASTMRHRPRGGGFGGGGFGGGRGGGGFGGGGFGRGGGFGGGGFGRGGGF